MGAPSRTPARILAEWAMERFHETLKPLLSAVGVRAVERRIGRPERFFQKTRERDSLRLSDYIATCAVLDRDPAELLAEALNDVTPPETRPPRIVAAAWKAIEAPGEGLGADRLAELESMVQSEAGQATRAILTRELDRACLEEIPQILGYYGSCLRIETDLPRADLVLKEAREVALAVEAPKVEADILIRLGFVSLEQQRVSRALGYAIEAILLSTRLQDLEGEGTAFLTAGTFRYYGRDYQAAQRDFQAALKRPLGPKLAFSAHQGTALCWSALGHPERAAEAVAEGRRLAKDLPGWLVSKLDWMESRLVSDDLRLDLLQKAKEGLCPARPADCALITVELIEEALVQGRQDLVKQETATLGSLLIRDLGPRVHEALIRLARHQGHLTAHLIADVKRAMDQALDSRLSRIVHEQELPRDD